MKKVAALYKAAPVLRGAQGAAMNYWREPDLGDLRPTVVPIKTATQKAAAKYWAHALSLQSSTGLTRSLKGRAFFVVDGCSSCLLALVAFRDPRKGDGDRDAMISWPEGLRERRLHHVVDAVRILIPEPFKTPETAAAIVDLMLGPKILGYVERKEAATFCAVTFETVEDDRTLDGVKRAVQVPADGRRLYLLEPRAKGLDYLRAMCRTEDVGPLTEPPRALRATTNRWDAERYTLPRLLLSAEEP